MQGRYYVPNSPLTPYFDPTSTPDWSPTFGISQTPLTEPKIPSVIVRTEQLDEWEEAWLQAHDGHHMAMEQDPRCGDDNAEFRFGDLPDSDGVNDRGMIWDNPDMEGPYHLLRCCGTDRPRGKNATLLVKATGQFLTIHNYVSAVHPWLMGLREDILRAMGDAQESEPLPANTKLLVCWPGPQELDVMEEKEWVIFRSENLPIGGYMISIPVQ